MLIAKEYRDYYLQRGVPASVLFATAPDTLEDHLTRVSYESNGSPKTISVDKQLEYLKGMRNLNKPYLCILGGATNDTIAGQIALLVCAQVIHDNAGQKIFWHTLTGAFKDKIRDDDVVGADAMSSSLLVISNIAQNSTNIKIEKLRDLLEIYSSKPRIVVLGGMNPMDFAQKILYTKPSCVLYSGR
jgi:hypothetical protein